MQGMHFSHQRRNGPSDDARSCQGLVPLGERDARAPAWDRVMRPIGDITPAAGERAIGPVSLNAAVVRWRRAMNLIWVAIDCCFHFRGEDRASGKMGQLYSWRGL